MEWIELPSMNAAGRVGMALTITDIAALKSTVPERFRPDPASIRPLIQSFGAVAELRSATLMYEGGASHNAHEFLTSDDPLVSDRAREMAGMALAGDADATAAFVFTGAQMARRMEAENQREDERRRDELVYDQIRAALDARLAELDAELARIDARLGEIRERRDELAERMEALDDLDTLAKSGKLDPDNPAHAALLRRAGIDPRTPRESIADVIAQQRRDTAREDEALEREWNERMKRRDEVIREREDVRAARREIESANTPEAMEQAQRRARTVLGAQQLGEAAYQTDNQRAKTIAADAVAANERSDRTASSTASNRRAASETGDYFAQSDDNDWEDAEAPEERSDVTSDNTPATRPAAALSIRPG